MKARREWLAAAALFALSAALRLAYVWSVGDSASVRYPIADSRAYYDAALRILAGDWIGDRIFYQDPLYPYFLAALYAVFEPGSWAVLAFQALLDAVSAVLIFEIARRVFGYRTGLAAGLLAALYKVFFYYDALLLKVPLSLFLTCLALLLVVRAAQGRRAPAAWLWAGLGLGLATLTRGNFLLFIGLLIVWIAVSGGGERAKRRAAVAWLALGLCLAILPVTLRNYAVGGDWVLVTSQAGQNFYIGNQRENRSGIYRAPPFVRATPFREQDDFRLEAERRTGRSLRPSELSRFWFREGLAEIAAEPGQALGHALRKLWIFVNDYEVPDNQSYQFFREHVSGLLRLPLPSFGVLLPFALAGALATRGNPGAGLLLLFLAAWTVSIVGFYNMSRYRIPVVPVVIVFAAAGLNQLFDWVRNRDWRRAGLLAGFAAVCLPFLHRPPMTESFAFHRSNIGIAHQWQADEHRDRALELARAGDEPGARAELERAAALWDLAEREFRRGLELDPDSPRLARALRDLLALRVEALENAGEHARALERARAFSRSYPRLPWGYVAQGRLHAALGEYAEAIQALQLALGIDPTHRAARRELARVRRMRATAEGG